MNKKINSLCFSSPSTIWISEFEKDGLVLFESVIPAPTVKLLKNALSEAIIEERSLRRLSDDENTVVCCPYYNDLFIEVAERSLFSVANELLGKDSILYSYSNSSIPPGKGNFSNEIHVERYYPSSYLDSVGMLLLLDDFNENNGGTYFLLGSHLNLQKPDSDYFYKEAKRLVAKSGSLLVFNPRLWHCGGVNRTSVRRDALTVGFCRSRMKQRLDYPYIFHGRSEKYSKAVKQKLGFYAQPPKSLSEFYNQGALGWSEKNN